ncbi:AraC family transcriptional regulator [Ralstonia sp. UBA689]|uniref:AraC family transcriptional regulator n=1 Tax=Ralstonia sp. UBA689 TaxID=1947373 RepID=UPI0025F49656|nr:AraC family transcriptional regulator [Ralstonia sp. UBA689]
MSRYRIATLEPSQLTTTATGRYLARMRAVLAHIDAHLDDALDVDQLAEVAAFSKYHFHRQFTLLFGMNVGRYVQLLRMKRAAHQLAYRDDARITDIALACGYEGPEAFARAFRKQTGQSPSAFRSAPLWTSWAANHHALRALRSEHMPAQPHTHPVEIVQREDVPVAAIEHRGSPAQLGDTIRAFIAWRREHRLSPAVSATYNIVYNNPDDVPPEAFRMDICAAARAPIAPNAAGIVGKTLAGGRYAVLRHTGSDDTLDQSAAYLYAEWLPGSGEALRDAPLLFQRVRFYPDVPEHEAVTDILLPLK